MMKTKVKKGMEHRAFAKAMNLPISTKHSIEISRFLRYKNTHFAKRFLEEVMALKKAVPFNRFRRNIGHKAGMASGRYPQKAAKEFLRLVKSVEANAQIKGLNISNLKITKILANKASLPMTGSRHRRGTKRTHLEIEVKEVAGKKREDANKKGESKSEIVDHKMGGSVPAVEKKSVEKIKKSLPEIIPSQKKKRDLESTTNAQNDLIASSKSLTTPKTEKEVVGSEIKLDSKIRTHLVVGDAASKVASEQVRKPQGFKTAEDKLPEVKELSPKELLEMAQKKAAELNRREKQDIGVKEVENLYEQMMKKGSLRNQGKNKVKK